MYSYKLVIVLFVYWLLVSCDQSPNSQEILNTASSVVSKSIEENYQIENDSLIYISGSIENFDEVGNSKDVYWIGENRDTILRFYRKYNELMELIGADYYEGEDVEPNRDTVYIDSNGRKVEASLNMKNRITWKSITTTDKMGNPILKTYENGKGEYRGLDSLYFDSKNRVVKGFYKNSKGRRNGVKTYSYIKQDKLGNWTEREMSVNDTLRQKHYRILSYHK